MNRPQPQILAIWRITLTLVAMIPAFLVSLLLKRSSAAWSVSVSVLAFAYIFMFVVYFPLLYQRISYSVSEDRIIYMTGVLYNRVISAPVSGIQFVSVSRTVVERVFGLASVNVIFAGGHIIISGLKDADAEALAGILQPV